MMGSAHNKRRRGWPETWRGRRVRPSGEHRGALGHGIDPVQSVGPQRSQRSVHLTGDHNPDPARPAGRRLLAGRSAPVAVHLGAVGLPPPPARPLARGPRRGVLGGPGNRRTLILARVRDPGLLPGGPQSLRRRDLGPGPGVDHDKDMRGQHDCRHQQHRPHHDYRQRIAPVPPTPARRRTLALRGSHRAHHRAGQPDARTAGTGDCDNAGREAGSASLELLILAPALMMMLLLVLWAGRVGRAGLVADLAAAEAAVAAAVACAADQTPGIDPQQHDACAEAAAADVLSTKPGLSDLCIGGPRPLRTAGDDANTHATAEGFVTRHGPALVVTLACDTDGSVAPLRGVFPTVQRQGHATHVLAPHHTEVP